MPVLESPGVPLSSEAPYTPYGAARELLYYQGDEAVIDGPAGTGKSRGILEKLFICCEKYGGCRILVIRKTRESLTESTLVTWEEKVVPKGHPCLRGGLRRNRQSYIFPNGSAVVCGGMDKPTKIMSTEYDIIYCPELIEFTEEEWEALSSRLRNNVIPYQQMLGDTNPDGPQHWIKQRANRGVLKLFNSRHEDNPGLYDRIKKAWTEFGLKYIARLENLTGVRKERLRFGRWVAAEGLVYETWDETKHRISPAEMLRRWPDWRSWPRFWVIDFGYRDPFVWQEWAIGPDRRLFRTREIYMTGRLVEDHAKQILAITGRKMEVDATGRPTKLITTRAGADALPTAIICDHDAEGRATLERHLGMQTTPAHKAILEGIQAVQARMKPEENGTGEALPRIFFVRDALQERDPELDEKKMPCCTEEEMTGYTWKVGGGRKKGEEPVDKDNHGLDTARYAVAFIDDIRSNGQENNQWWIV